MKKYLRSNSVLFSVIIVLFCLLSISPIAIAVQPAEITVLFTHDMHSNIDEYVMPADNPQLRSAPIPAGKDGTVSIGGFDRLATVIRKERKGKENRTVLVDAGDFTMGTLFHTIRSTYAPELCIMGMLKYDAITLGNHEFEFGSEDLAKTLTTAKKLYGKNIPAIVASNINPSNTTNAATAETMMNLRKVYDEYPVLLYKIINRSGLKIGIFGLMGRDAAFYAPEAYPVTFTDYIESACKTVNVLRIKEHVDMVICLSHTGTSSDKSKSEDELLAKQVPGIDVIISGHTHTVMNPYIRIGNTYIVSGGCYSRYLGKLDLVRKPDGSFTATDYQLLPITSAIAPDKAVHKKIEGFIQAINNDYLRYFNMTYNEKIAYTSFNLNDYKWGEKSRSKLITSGLGDMVTDSFRYAVKQIEGDSYEPISLVVEGIGQIRVPLATGVITSSDSFRLMALGLGDDGKAGSALTIFWLTGAEIREIMEIEATLAVDYGLEDLRLEISGMRFSYSVKDAPFDRVKFVEVEQPNGGYLPLDDKKLYRVCTNWKTIAMRENLYNLSKGKIRVVFKDAYGKPIDNLAKTRIYVDAKKTIELKEWVAVAKYLQSFPKTKFGLSNLPDKYLSPSNRVIELQ